MKYVKLYIKTLLCCILFGSIDTVGMGFRIDLLELLEIMVGVLFIFFPIVLLFNSIFFPDKNNSINLGKCTVEEYNSKKAVVSKYNPFMLSYMHNEGISVDKALYIEIYYLLFNGYLKIVDNNIVVTDKNRDLLKKYQIYLVEKIESKEKVIFKEWKKIYEEEMKKMDIIISKSYSNITKGLFMIIICPIFVVLASLVFRFIQIGATALLVFVAFGVMINYFVEGFFLMFKKKVNYTSFGLSELNRINIFAKFIKSHTPFPKEENIILYYDYLLHRYSLFDEKDLFKDNELKLVYDIIKKYVFSN